MCQTYFNFIAGEWVPSRTGDTYPSINPANTEEILGHFQKSNEQDVEDAIEAAQRAFPGWSRQPAPSRGDILFRLIRQLEDEQEELSALIVKEVGKTLREARGEVHKTIEAMKQFSGEATRLAGETLPSRNADLFAYTVREPIGVGVVIAPYNFPLGIGIWKIAPAIVAGNTVVFKPASNTSRIGTKIVELFQNAGVPAGVINMVTGPGSVVGKVVANHQDVKAVSFTGSSEVGIGLGRTVTARGGRMQAEMGGKNPAIILEDADLEKAIDSIVVSVFLDNGQRCTGTSRVIVPRTIAADVRDLLVNRAKTLKVGDGFLPDVDNGAVIDDHQLNTYLHYVQKAEQEGATLEYGGTRLMDEGRDKGFFVAPTVFSHVDSRMAIAQEEIFGPVIALMEVETYEQALKVANDIEFGLSSTIYTRDLKRAFHFVRSIESGVTHVNLPSTYFENQFPFGGKKDSSIGPREQGSTALEFWTDIKTVYINPGG